MKTVVIADRPTISSWHSGTGKVISIGDIVKVSGVRGRFTVKRFDEYPVSGQTATVLGGVPGDFPVWRTFTVDRITVDRKATRKEST